MQAPSAPSPSSRRGEHHEADQNLVEFVLLLLDVRVCGDETSRRGGSFSLCWSCSEEVDRTDQAVEERGQHGRNEL
jgi:hypothetical protein